MMDVTAVEGAATAHGAIGAFSLAAAQAERIGLGLHTVHRTMTLV